MATKTVQWSSTKRLDCACCYPAAVQILVGLNDVIPATLVHVVKLSTSRCNRCRCNPCSCGYAASCATTPVYQYTFNYDEDVLPGDATSISESSISDVECEGAFTAWVNQQIGLATRPIVFHDVVHEVLISFMGDANGTTEDIDYVVTNPSALRPATVIFSWRWNLMLRGNDQYGVCGIGTDILEDGVIITGYASHDANFSNQEVGVGAYFDAQGGGGSYAMELAAGQSKTFTLRFEKEVSSSPEPDVEYGAQDILINVLGITT